MQERKQKFPGFHQTDKTAGRRRERATETPSDGKKLRDPVCSFIYGGLTNASFTE